MPYTHRSAENLVREGILREKIVVTGNPIREVLDFYGERIDDSDILSTLNVTPHAYFLATLHRAETVDDEGTLKRVWEALKLLGHKYEHPIVIPLHPRTLSKVVKLGLTDPSIMVIKPMGFFDFVKLEASSRCVLTDSGTVQEECSILNIPSVTVRNVTERPETIEAGSNILVGAESSLILRGVSLVLDNSVAWIPPHEYMGLSVSRTVAKVLLSALS